MFRQFTAFVLFTLMTAMTATGQYGLRYCSCLHELFISDCECAELVENGSCQLSETCESPACGKRQTVPDSYSTDELSRNCFVDLYIHLDDFDASEVSQLKCADKKAPSSAPLALIPTWRDGFAPSATGNRGPPPFVGLIPSEPLRVRYSVFLV